ncbi:insertion element IS1 protein InsB [Deinococcus metalli]|uniref:Insertion element IS1 protein InsB n=2 Tax=Deinococcus metalli TaxID=1141878 RepID=A0A7W8NRZ8_9DEIO|nr:IS1 family transposase [Deinococcus metalli]MBB5378395.1 insertion element IS1 protein InsB [Deinococcus metalli]
MSTPAPATLVLECDELCTFVGRHDRPRWIWLAMDRATRRIVGCFIGQRDAPGAFGLWQSIPAPYLDAVCHTDGLRFYRGVVFGALHRIGGTQHIERDGATLRLRLAHLVRQSLSFSRQQTTLETLVWLFLHRYNTSLS